MPETLNDILPRLEAFETRLSSLFTEIEYISEVPILREEYTRISADLRAIQTGMGLSKTTRLLRNKWPHIFVTFLSITAAYNENRGYWQAVVDKLDITSTQSIFSGNNHWGKIYLELLNRYGLNDFSDIKSGFPYVNPIRLQGGIPRYSLPDFFEYYVLPSTEHPSLAMLPDEEAFEEVQKRTAAKYYADRVIKLYMKNGGGSAQDFFAKCRKMARITNTGAPLPAPSKLALRPYVVELFEDYLANRVERSSSQRIYSPRVTFWPHQPAFSLLFPEQSILDSKAHYKYHWRLKLYDNDQLIKESLHSVRVYRKGRDVQTRSVDISLDHPVTRAVVDFGFIQKKAGKKEFRSVRSWPLRLLPALEMSQVVAFSGDGNPIRLSEGLPADVCWMLVPKESSICPVGDAVKLEKVDTYWSPWDQWKAEFWDLSGADIVEISQVDQLRSIYPVIHPIPEPKLIGENQNPFSRVINEQPLFVGNPPQIELYFDRPHSLSLTEFLDDWRLSIKSLGITDPIIEETLSIDGDRLEISRENGSVRVSLTRLLGTHPVGIYEVKLSHTDGKEFELPFRSWPALEIQGLDPLILPNGEGGKDLLLQFDLPGDAHLDPITDFHRTSRQPIIRSYQQEEVCAKYQVEIPPGVTTGAFILSYPLDEQNVHVPLDLCIPRLRWALSLGGIDTEELEWKDTLQKVSLPKLQQAELAQLYLGAELPKDSKYSITLILKLPGGDEDLQIVGSKKISSHESRCNFALNVILDTIREYQSYSLFDLEALIEGGSLAEPVHLPVLRISRTINVTNVWLEIQDECKVSLHWNEPNPLRNRRAQIWNVWRPWEDPQEIKVPDDPPSSDQQEGWYMYELPTSSSAHKEGCYAVRFIAAPNWEKRPVPKFPPQGEIRYVQTTDPKRRLAELKRELKKGPEDLFAIHFERACIFGDINDDPKRDNEISWCSSNAIQAKLPLLVCFYHWLNDMDPYTQKALRMRMVQPDWLLNLFLQTEDLGLRQEYLRPLLREEKFHPDSAKIVLDHAEFPELISLAITTLVDDENSHVVKYLLDHIDRGKFSVLGAFEVLKPKADFALFSLLDLPESEHRSRLLQELSIFAEIPLIAYPGWWIRSDAGWGRIDDILEEDSGAAMDYFRIDKETPVLDVTLRPGSNELEIEIDLSNNQIRFEDSELYLCTHNNDCYRYITNDREQLITVHNRVAHEGLQPRFRVIHSNTYQMHQDIIFSPTPPEEIDG